MGKLKDILQVISSRNYMLVTKQSIHKMHGVELRDNIRLLNSTLRALQHKRSKEKPNTTNFIETGERHGTN